MSWLDPPPLVPKPMAPEVRLPAEVRPRNVAIMVLATAIFFAAMAFGIGYGIFALLSSLGVSIVKIRTFVLLIVTLIGGFVGYHSGWRTIQETIRDHQSHDHA